MLTPYEQFYIQTLHMEGKLIPEQYQGDTNPLFELAIHLSHTPHDKSQLHNHPHPGSIACCSARNSRPPPTKGMYSESFSF